MNKIFGTCFTSMFLGNEYNSKFGNKKLLTYIDEIRICTQQDYRSMENRNKTY